MCLTLAACHLAISISRRQPRSRRRQPRSRRRSVSCDLANVNKRKLRNFDRPLGLPGHHQRIFTLAMCHIVKKWRRASMTTAVAVSREACCHHLHFAENPQFCTFILPPILRNSISHFAFCFVPTPTTRRDSIEEPAALESKQCRWAMQEPVWQEWSVCFVSVLFLCGILCCLILFNF